MYTKVKNGIALDSIQPDLHKATMRIIELRNSGHQAESFTEAEIIEMQTQQPGQQLQPTQRHQPTHQQPRTHKMGICPMPQKRPAITVGMNHIQRRRR